MSSGTSSLFFSSPPRQMGYCEVYAKPAFLTPPHSRSAWNTQSPLLPVLPRRSLNRANLMSRPLSSFNGLHGDEENSIDDRYQLLSKGTQIESLATTKHLQDIRPVDPAPSSFFLTTDNINPSNIFQAGTSTTTTNTSLSSRAATQFQYEARARASSSTVRLQSQTATNRESRKRQFHDRLRTKRDDARFERNGEQVLRMEWLNERKAWEEHMARARLDDTAAFAGEDEEEEEDESGMSPIEEKELDDLVSYLDSHPLQAGPEEAAEGDDEFGSGDDDYDALFMEIADQDPTSLQNHGHAQEAGKAGDGHSPLHDDGPVAYDEEMDMS